MTNKKHFWQPLEQNAAYKTHTEAGAYIVSYNTCILLHKNGEYSIFDDTLDSIILVCKDGTVIDEI